MKKIILLFGLFLFFIISCGSEKIESSEQAFDYIKGIKNYISDIKITFVNEKSSESILLKQYASSDYGYRIDFENERRYFYRDEKIYVKDIKNKREYFVDEKFDEIYRYCFLNEYMKLIYSMDEVDYFKQLSDNGNGIFFASRVNLPTNNLNISHSILYLREDSYLPFKFEIFDNKGHKRILIEYITFDVLEKIDPVLFEY